MARMPAGSGNCTRAGNRSTIFRLAPVLFELEYDAISGRALPAYTEISKFPLVRRDIAAEFDEDVGYQAILEELRRRPAARS